MEVEIRVVVDGGIGDTCRHIFFEDSLYHPVLTDIKKALSCCRVLDNPLAYSCMQQSHPAKWSISSERLYR